MFNFCFCFVITPKRHIARNRVVLRVDRFGRGPWLWSVGRTQKRSRVNILMRNFAQRGKEKPWGIVTKSCVWRYPGPARSLRNFWWSVKGFGRGKGSNFPFPHWLASSPLQNSRTTVRVCDQKGRNGHGNRNTCENGVCTMQGSRQFCNLHKCVVRTVCEWHSCDRHKVTHGRRQV